MMNILSLQSPLTATMTKTGQLFPGDTRAYAITPHTDTFVRFSGAVQLPASPEAFLTQLGQTLWLFQFKENSKNIFINWIPGVSKASSDEKAKALSKQLWQSVFSPWTKDLSKSQATLESWEKSRPQSPLALYFKVLPELLETPETLQGHCDLLAHMVLAGGIKPLRGIAREINSPAFQALPLKDKAAFIETKAAPYLQAALSKPTLTRQQLFALEQGLKKNLPPDQIGPVGLFAIRYLQDGLQAPETLQANLKHLSRIMHAGGYAKVAQLANLQQTDLLKMLRHHLKAELLLSGTDTIIEALEAHPADSQKLLGSVAESLEKPPLDLFAYQTLTANVLRTLSGQLAQPQAFTKTYQQLSQLYRTGQMPLLGVSLAFLEKTKSHPEVWPETMAFLNRWGEHGGLQTFSNFMEAVQNQRPLNTLAPQLRTMLETLQETLTENPETAEALLTQWSNLLTENAQPGFFRDSGLLFLQHLKRQLQQPEKLSTEVNLILELLENGGLAKLETLRKKLQNGDFDKADARQKGQWVFSELGPLFQTVLNQKEAVKSVLEGYEATLNEVYPESLIRDTLLAFLKHFQINLDRPERLKKAVTLTKSFLFNGGFEKLETLNQIVKTPDYKSAAPVRQGQMLLEGLGPIFVKAFQTLSTMPDLFSPTVQKSMVKLYEDITPLPYETIKKVIESELGIPIEEAFDSFESEPLKAGSIAQVHRAVYRGIPVAIKIVKPGIEDSMERDLATLRPMVELGQQMAPHINTEEMFEDFEKLIKNECNMSNQKTGGEEGEAERLEEIWQRFKYDTRIAVPKVVKSRTSKHILTMEFMNGHSLLTYKGNPRIAAGYLSILMDQIFKYGACQADPHPGNILYDPVKEKFACIDAGLLYFVSKQEQANFAKLLVALYSQSSDAICRAILVPGMMEEPAYETFKAQMANTTIDPSRLDYKSTLKYLNLAAKTANNLGLQTIEINPLLWKTLFTAISVAKTMDPTTSIGSPAIMNVATLMLKNFDPGFLWSVTKATSSRATGNLVRDWVEPDSTLGRFLEGKWGFSFGKKPPDDDPNKPPKQ